MRPSRCIAVVCLFAFAALGTWIVLTGAQRGGFGGGPMQEPLRFRFMGPSVGNRIASAAGVPGDLKTYYAGASSGGVWKSVDGAVTWTPVFDDQTAAAIGSLAVTPSNPSIVWAGTGEAWAIRDVDMNGDGIYKSVDAGKTWTNMGLADTGRIGRIIVHPTNPDIVYAAALGRMTGPQQERGVFKTSDGGKTWTRSLFVDVNTGCSGLAMDPKDPNVLFAGMWQVEMHTYAMFSGGPGSGLWRSADGGATWKKLEGRGLPKPPVGKIDVAIAPSDSKRVYALIQTPNQGSIWRSDDGGDNWKVGSWQRALIGRAGYYIRLAVSPANPDEVFVASSSFHQSLDGGKTFRTLPWGGDTHEIWIDPSDANRVIVTDDGGMSLTTDHGKTSRRITLPIAQLYHVAVDNDVPYRVYTNMQDNGTMRGLSTTPEIAPGTVIGASRGGGGWISMTAPAGLWDHGIGGCESGFTIPDPTDSNIIWATCYGNEVTRYDHRTRLARSVSPWFRTLDSPPNTIKWRAHWTPPLAIDPFDHNTVYYGTQYIHKTTDGGSSWTVISPDLSTADPRYIISSGGIVGDNLGQFYGCVVFAIAPSPIQKGLVWAGTNDGKVWYTDDGGAKWNDVTANIKGVPPLGTIAKIDPSHFDAGTAYITVDLHLMDNRDPFIFKTADYGRTWTKITGNLPKGPLAYARVVAENPNRKGMLFAGTGNALYYTMDDGMNWTRLKDGLPPAPVSWIVVQKQAHDLVVSTYGRGIYIMEDLTPLEQGFRDGGFEGAAKIYKPRPAYRLVRGGRSIMHYALKAAPQGPVGLEILDQAGAVVRKVTVPPGRAGLNRVSWDLRHEPPKLVALRTTPPENPHIWEEPRFQKAETRPITHWGVSSGTGPIAAPGAYIARLTVDGESLVQPIEVLLPPSNTGTAADIQESVKLQLRIRDHITEVAGMVNQIEYLRRRLEDARKAVVAAGAQKARLKLIDDLDKKMLAVRDRFITRSEAMSDDKYFVETYKIYLNLMWMAQVTGTGGGDTAGSADYGPTKTAIGLVADLEKEIGTAAAEYKGLIEKDVPAFNKAVAGAAWMKPLELLN